MVKFHDILTPEQRNKVVDKMKEMREKIKDRHKKRHDKKYELPPEKN